MELKELSEIDRDQFNQFVAAQESGSFLQGFEWGQWQASLGRDVYRYWILDEGDNEIGSIQFIKMPIIGKYFYLYAPYGPVVNTQYTVDSNQLIQNLKEKFPDAVFVRIEPKSATGNTQSLIKSSNIQPGKSLVIDLSKSLEQLLSEMHHKTRYNIKVAQKHGVEIKDEFALSIGHGLFFEEALQLILETSKRQGFSTFGSNYYKKLVDFFALQNNQGDIKLHIYKAIFQNQLLATAIMIDFGSTRTFLFGGSSLFHKNVMAPYLLHFQAMLDAKNSGLNFYDFWGIETSSGATPGFVRFKLGFGGSEKIYAGAYDVVINLMYYNIYKAVRFVNKTFRKLK